RRHASDGNAEQFRPGLVVRDEFVRSEGGVIPLDIGDRRLRLRWAAGHVILSVALTTVRSRGHPNRLCRLDVDDTTVRNEVRQGDTAFGIGGTVCQDRWMCRCGRP